MAPNGSVRFNKLAGAEMRWRHKTFPYGEGRPGTRSIMPAFKNKLTHALVDLWILSGLGPADRIVSAGAWVPEGTNGRGPDDKHVQGIAIDIDAIHWPGESLFAHPDHSEPDFYLGVEAHFRCYFHTVLGWSYDGSHNGHWHIDDGQELRSWKASSTTKGPLIMSFMASWAFSAERLLTFPTGTSSPL